MVNRIRNAKIDSVKAFNTVTDIRLTRPAHMEKKIKVKINFNVM